MTQSPRKRTIAKDLSTKTISIPCKRSFISKSSKLSYRISDPMPNCALQLQPDDLTTATNLLEQIKMASATNLPEHIHLTCGKKLQEWVQIDSTKNSPNEIQPIIATNSAELIQLATSIDSLGSDINIREEASQEISCKSVLSKRHYVKNKSQQPSNCSESNDLYDADDPADVTFEPNITDMMAGREKIKSVSFSEELKAIYEHFLNYLKGPECCQKNAEETVN